jgi:triosephosphate isomerase
MLDAMQKTFFLAANWKMYAPPARWDAPDSPFQPKKGLDVYVFPPLLWLPECVEKGLNTGAQCGHPQKEGAHTGSVSMEMIAKAGAKAVICGHSERRKEYCESDDAVITQARAALEAGILPIVCVGETWDERSQNAQEKVVARQLLNLPEGCIVAYEPVWAIGSGQSATPKDFQEMHTFIQNRAPKGTRILYGGSVTAENAHSILSLEEVDGCLVGGASRKKDEWKKIVDTALSLS